MKPDEPSRSQSGMSLPQQGMSSNNPEKQLHHNPQEAAAKIIRSQIDDLFEIRNNQNSNNVISNQSKQLEDINPYQREHIEHPVPEANEWKKYHTAWQDYYKKYYEGYYKHTIENTTKSVIANPNNIPRNRHNYFTHHKIDQPEKIFTDDEAVFDIRQKLIGKVHSSATKIKKSKHFIPIFSGLIVVLVFIFLQYNRIIFSNVLAYVSPGNINPQNIIVDPNADIVVDANPRIIIPKINVDVPVMYDVGNDYDSQMAAMSVGLAQFAIPGANSHPGEIGNTVLAGHSSSDLLDSGDYKFIFAQLDKLDIGDTVYANYKSKRYTYTVTKKEVVKPTDVGKLVYPTTKPMLTLLTCTPVGTAISRLLVTAEQISPDPSQSVKTPAKNEAVIKTIPGNTPNFFEYLFGG